MKHCCKCETTKSFSEFNKRGKKYQPWCKQCKSLHYKNRRKGRESEFNLKNYQFEAIRRLNLEEQVVQYLNKHPCNSCGEDNILVLEFDHLRDKEFNIAEAIGFTYSWKRIKKEIDKCQVLCANCHRIKTAKSNNTWKLKYIKDSIPQLAEGSTLKVES